MAASRMTKADVQHSVASILFANSVASGSLERIATMTDVSMNIRDDPTSRRSRPSSYPGHRAWLKAQAHPRLLRDVLQEVAGRTHADIRPLRPQQRPRSWKYGDAARFA